MGNRSFAFGLVACIALTLAGLIGARTADAQLVAGFDDLHWTASSTAGVLLAWRGLTLTQDALIRRGARWFVAGMAAMLLGQLTWDVQTAFNWQTFPGPADVIWLGTFRRKNAILERGRRGAANTQAAAVTRRLGRDSQRRSGERVVVRARAERPGRDRC